MTIRKIKPREYGEGKYGEETCIDCGKVRKIKNWYIDYKKRHPRCNSCALHKRRNLRARGLRVFGLKRCTICKRVLPLEYFHRNRIRWDGLTAFCKECNVEKSRIYREGNRDKINGYGRKSHRNHKDRSYTRTASNRRYPDRQICSIEGCFELGEKHHPDYSNPDGFTWLCRKHHAELHAKALVAKGLQ